MASELLRIAASGGCSKEVLEGEEKQNEEAESDDHPPGPFEILSVKFPLAPVLEEKHDAKNDKEQYAENDSAGRHSDFVGVREQSLMYGCSPAVGILCPSVLYVHQGIL